MYDGHRGSEAAQFVSEEISGILANCLLTFNDPETAFKQTYLQLESNFEASGLSSFPDPKGTRFPGCTALTALIWQDQLVLANAGWFLLIGCLRRIVCLGLIQAMPLICHK